MTPQTAAATITGYDPQRVEDVLLRLSPKWTTGVVHTIAKYGPEMQVYDIARHFPSVGQSFMSKRLATMQEAGLVARDAAFDRRAPYRLTQQALTLGPVYRSLAQWSSEHVDRSPRAPADRIENALHLLEPAYTTKVVHLLAENGSMRFTHLAEAAGTYPQLITRPLARLQEDGLVTRTGTRHGDPYTLTEAGHALGPVFEAVQRWDDRHAPAPAAPVPTAVRTLTGPVSGADGARTAAALRRTPVPAALFSHSPQQQQQPRIPAAATAASSPARGR